MAGSEFSFSDRRQGNQQAVGVYYSFALFIYGFLVIIALITIFNVINSVGMSVSARMKQYGAMRAIGMSTRQLIRVVTAEAAAYSLAGSVVGCLIGLPIHKYLFEHMVSGRWGDPWNIPIANLIIVDAVIRETKEETGLDIQNPRLCGIKQFPIENGRYIVFLFHTDEFSGEVTSSEDGEMVWVKSQNCQRTFTIWKSGLQESL